MNMIFLEILRSAIYFLINLNILIDLNTLNFLNLSIKVFKFIYNLHYRFRYNGVSKIKIIV